MIGRPKSRKRLLCPPSASGQNREDSPAAKITAFIVGFEYNTKT
jgi:hypothetical protein